MGLPWSAICDQAAGPIAALDLDGRYIYVNPALCELFGYPAERILGHHPIEFTTAGDPAISREVIAEVIDGLDDTYVMQKRFNRADGRVIWVLVNGAVVRDADKRPLFFFVQVHDVSAQHESELLWRRTLTNAPIGMALLDLDGHWTEVNDKLCELVGYRREELLTMHFTDLTYPDDNAEGPGQLADLAEGRLETIHLEKRYRHKDGHPFWMLIRSSAVRGPDGRPAYLVSQYEVIGNGRMSDSHLARMALHDPLTGLANRALLNDRLEHELTELASKGGVVGVVLADLDHLKRVNDDYGHAVGDYLLTTAAHQLLSVVRAGDTVARLGGDEFVVVTRTPDANAVRVLRDRIATALHTDLVAFGHHLRMRASVGFATTADSGIAGDALLHGADQEMYKHKKRNRR